MRVLVTGGAGFIGSHLVDAFLARHDDVAVVDDLSHGQSGRLDSRVALHALSVTDPRALADLVGRWQPELVCHLAAQIDVRTSTTDPGRDAHVNVVGTVNVLHAAQLARARVVFASSGGALYGEHAPIPTQEDVPPLPESPYGIGKLCGEHYVGLFNRLYGASHSVLRLGNVYGPRQDPAGEAGVVAVFCAAVLARTSPVVYGDGSQTRDYVQVSDVVRAFLAAADNPRPGVWNIGTDTETSVKELVNAIEQIAGRPVTTRQAPPRPGELQRSAVATSRAARDLDWRSTTPLGAGVATVYHWIAAGAPNRGLPHPVR